MAEHLASIFGTEKDRVNCPFFLKIGACRHGDRCSRIHNKPTNSPTLLMPNMYLNPAMIMGPNGPSMTDPRQLQEHFEDFYEDIFEELDKFGEVENLNICDNLADHLVGNVYVKFREEESAAAAHAGLAGRFYSGRPIVVEFSPVTDFRESTCRQYEENTCNRGGYCNFMHLKPISRDLRRRLYGRYKPRSRSPKRGSRRSRSRSRERGGGGRHEERDRGGDRERRRSRSRDRDRDRRRSRSRDKDKGRDAVIAKGMTDEERRAMIAGWNSKPAAAAEGGEAPAEPQEAGAGGAAAEAPQQQAGEAPQ